MSNLYKDRIVDEADKKPRYNLVDRDGNIVVEDVKLELSSAVLQEGDRFGAREINTFVDRSDDGEIITSKFIRREAF